MEREGGELDREGRDVTEPSFVLHSVVRLTLFVNDFVFITIFILPKCIQTVLQDTHNTKVMQ